MDETESLARELAVAANDWNYGTTPLEPAWHGHETAARHLLASDWIVEHDREVISKFAESLIEESIRVNNSAITEGPVGWWAAVRRAEHLSIAADVIKRRLSDDAAPGGGS